MSDQDVTFNVFISYSRQNAHIVGILVRFLRVVEAKLFLDSDHNSIPLGVKWKHSIAQAIEGCECFLLFWSREAAQSPEVKKEVDQAIQHNKKIVPVMLDDTELGALGEYNGVDLRPLANPCLWVSSESETDTWSVGEHRLHRIGPTRATVETRPSDQMLSAAAYLLLMRLVRAANPSQNPLP